MSSTVAVLKTSPTSVLDDYHQLMHLANYESFLPKENKTIIKLNLSWTLFYPACSTPPWQLEALLQLLRDDGYKDIVAVENQTVVTHPWRGAYNNKWLPILKEYGVEYQPLTDADWVVYKPKAQLLAMGDIFSNVIIVPKIFIGANIIHLPTIKTHGHTMTTGAMKNAFGGLIPKYRHHAHRRIHEILVDLLTIQKEIHQGIFACIDGCVCGNGAGPRTMQPFVGNLILGSNDQVAIDALATKIMGFDPIKVGYIRMAHSSGLGTGDVDQIEVVGMNREDFERLNFGFHARRSPVIAFDQIMRRQTVNVHWLYRILFHSNVFKTFIFASEFYHDRLWYPFVGKHRVDLFMDTEWGQKFRGYEYGQLPEYREVRDWDPF